MKNKFLYLVILIFCLFLETAGLGSKLKTELPFYERNVCQGWLVRIPKVVLHHHLDGSVRPETILDIARKQNIDLGVPLTLAAVRDAATVRVPQANLVEVLKRFWFFQKIFTSYDNVKRVTLENIEDLYNDGVRLAELRFAPAFMSNGIGISAEDIIYGVADALVEGKKRFPEIQVGLIHIVVRSHAGANVEEMKQMNETSTHAAIAFRNSNHPMANRMVGFDFAGSEVDTPTSDYTQLARIARDGGLKITVHSGEDSSADRVRQSVDLLNAKRIGHGVQVWGDADVRRYLRDHDIHLEISPSSNWITNHIPGVDVLEDQRTPRHRDLKQHPIADIWRSGISISIEGDDPQLFGIGIVHEYQLLHYLMGLNKRDFYEVNKRALGHSFLPDEAKQTVLNQYFSDQQEQEHLVALADLDETQLAGIREQILAGTQSIHEAMDPTPGHHMLPIPETKLDKILDLNKTIPLSYVWMEGNQVAGFILMNSDVNPANDTATIQKLGVLPRFRSKGISRKLLHAFARAAMNNGFENIDLLVGKDNRHAIQNTYLRYGFNKTGTNGIWLRMKAQASVLEEKTRFAQ
ncbi:MAG: GNAT family N-acetyltransferase [Bacteriovoracia bacterium]